MMELQERMDQLRSEGNLRCALQAAGEAEWIARRLLRNSDNAARHRPYLAVALQKKSVLLSELGEIDDAIVVRVAAIAIWEELAERAQAEGERADYLSHLRALAIALVTLSHLFAERANNEQALNAIEQARLHFAMLSDTDEAEKPGFSAQAATMMGDYANRLSAVDRLRDAVVASLEAVRRWRRVVAEDPSEAYDLALALANLGAHFAQFRRLLDAVGPLEEALEMFRQFPPDQRGLPFQRAVANLAQLRTELGQRPETNHSHEVVSASDAPQLSYSPERSSAADELGPDIDAVAAKGAELAKAERFAEAEPWLLQAAAGCDPNSLYWLGLAYERLGRLQDALLWYERGAKTGGAAAAVNLAMLKERLGDDTESEDWFRDAAEGGHPFGAFNLAVCLAQRGETQEAAHWYRLAADAGDTDAMYNLALLLFNEPGPGEAEADEAEHYLGEAAEAGSLAAMNALGTLCWDRGRLDDAQAWFERGAAAGDDTAAQNLAGLVAFRRQRGV